MAKKGTAPVRVGDRRELEIEGLVGGGEAIARLDGFPIFVPYAVPGDRIRARVISTKPGYARALIEEVLAPGPLRVQPECPVFSTCGGCQWQALGYADQVEWKTRLVAEALQRTGGLDPAGILKPTLPSPSPWHYRNKVHWAVGKAGGKWLVGLYEPRSHQIVDAPTCRIQGEANNQMLAVVRELLPRFDFEPYDEATGAGWLRSIFTKTGHGTGEVMLGLVTKNEFFDAGPAFVEAVRAAFPGVTTIVQNVHPEPGNKLLGRETIALFGPGVIREKIGPLEFSISAEAFFQVNAAAIELLYGEVAKAAHLETKPRVLDAYCGTGSIALFLAAQGARDVVGIEIVDKAVEDARANATRNGLEARFLVGAVEALLPKVLVAEGAPDVLVLDPPRKGCEPEVLAAVAKAGAARVIYVSCNPVTLARDLKLLAPTYVVESVQPVDMFPQTAHVECVAVLKKAAPAGTAQ
ncbi:MAG: rlmCD [Cyanobacteria bacterium RYN_339]|nr:rlmCD [Cyanobacteria bacterium RYN_339]